MSAPPTDRLTQARQVADALLYEGYVLFPYRASALKNRYRWQWGVVIPRDQVDLGATEPSALSCEVLLRAPAGTSIDVTARFLHLRLRQLVDAEGTPVDELEVDGEPVPTWEEGLEHEVTVRADLPHQRGNQLSQQTANRHTEQTPDRQATDGHAVRRFELDAASEVERLGEAGHAVRTTWRVTGELRVDLEPVTGDVWKLRATVSNDTPWSQRRAPRDEVLRRSIVGVHVLADADDGVFASVVDPPAWADRDLRQRGLHPVLVGGSVRDRSTPAGDDGREVAEDGTAVVLAAPIILYDHPRIAPESPGPSFDATEVDELLALAVMGLTDDEKRRARATDPRAAALIERTESLPAAVQERLHGAVRDWGPGAVGPGARGAGFGGADAGGPDGRGAVDLRPEPGAGIADEVRDLLGVGEEPLRSVTVTGHDVAVGDRVRLRPSRRADAHDLFVAGRVALVERIVRTVEGDTYLAVTVDDDPAADLHRWYGRFQYFGVDEIEPLAGAASSSPPRAPADDSSTGTMPHEGG